MRIGYSFWGYLGDYKYDLVGNEVSTPDGNAAYSWAFVWEAMQRGHQVVPLQFMRDGIGHLKHGSELFASFSQQKRNESYLHLEKNVFGKKGTTPSWAGHPELDVVLVEWRFPIPGRNTPEMRGVRGYQEDLDRQTSILKHYLDLDVPVILWDLDHKLTLNDEMRWRPHAIFETSDMPEFKFIWRTKVDFPFVAQDLLQYGTLPADPKRKLVYVGNRYERDDVIDDYVKDVSDLFPGEVEFWGKWDAADQKWPNISYHGRIAMRDFRSAYGTAVACPILAKRSYFRSGFMTPRPVEALLFGTIPVGFEEHRGVENYVDRVVVHPDVAADPPGRATNSLGRLALAYELKRMSDMTLTERSNERTELAHKLAFKVDAGYFVDEVERVVNGYRQLVQE